MASPVFIWKLHKSMECTDRYPGSPAGFTLVEVLIALLIFALVAGSLVKATSHYVDNARLLRDANLGLLVADNEMSRLRLNQRTEEDFPPLGTRRHRVAMAGSEWILQVEVTATDHQQIRRVEMAVLRPEEVGDRPVVRLEGFVGEF